MGVRSINGVNSMFIKFHLHPDWACFRLIGICIFYADIMETCFD